MELKPRYRAVLRAETTRRDDADRRAGCVAPQHI
jgi:hypothetical protein